MTATLDEVADLLRELIRETKLSRWADDVRHCGPVAPPDDTEDPKVHFDPKTWGGDKYKGSTFSQCPPDYLLHLARALTNIARKERAEGKRSAKGALVYVYTLQGAARARRWAIRLRSGWKPPDKPSLASGGGAALGSGAKPFGGSGSPFGGSRTPLGATAAPPATAPTTSAADHGDVSDADEGTSTDAVPNDDDLDLPDEDEDLEID